MNLKPTDEPFDLSLLFPSTTAPRSQLLQLADAAIVRESAAAARKLSSAEPDEIVHIAAALSAKLINYLAVRAILSNECV